MANASDKLEALLEKVRQLPPGRQAAVIDALSEIIEEPYQLTADERAVLLPALEEALRGENLTDAATDPLLTEPWN